MKAFQYLFICLIKYQYTNFYFIFNKTLKVYKTISFIEISS